MSGQAHNDPVFQLQSASKNFGEKAALDRVSLEASDCSIIGLIGRNGSGKTTLLRILSGLYLPTAGTANTLGVATSDLGVAQLRRLGVAHQQPNLVGWMRIGQLTRYVASFYDKWDVQLEKGLMSALELGEDEHVGSLSPGNVQRLAILLAVCHRPRLLLLDEPFSSLDPTGREVVLSVLLQLFRESEMTILLSSHLLYDIERVVDRVVCLHCGGCVTDAPLDQLVESYAEWTVRSASGALPAHFAESFVLSSGGDARQARLVVRDAHNSLPLFKDMYGVEIETRPLSLTRIFPLLTGEVSKTSRGVDSVAVNRGAMAARVE